MELQQRDKYTVVAIRLEVSVNLSRLIKLRGFTNNKDIYVLYSLKFKYVKGKCSYGTCFRKLLLS